MPSLIHEWLFLLFRAKLVSSPPLKASFPNGLPSYISGMCLVHCKAKGHRPTFSKRWLAVGQQHLYESAFLLDTLKSLAMMTGNLYLPKAYSRLGVVIKAHYLGYASRRRMSFIRITFSASSIPDLYEDDCRGIHYPGVLVNTKILSLLFKSFLNIGQKLACAGEQPRSSARSMTTGFINIGLLGGRLGSFRKKYRVLCTSVSTSTTGGGIEFHHMKHHLLEWVNASITFLLPIGVARKRTQNIEVDKLGLEFTIL
ncbi:hypothetical protein Tco_0769962 [Tanacetum coccineum]|uniref:Uncharacterized protein n=1 Tax=Tanacetum coccineum TaxID=301880 RepID=A0ABQ4ZCR6_9ASTR